MTKLMSEIRKNKAQLHLDENDIQSRQADITERVTRVLDTMDMDELDLNQDLIAQMDSLSEDPICRIASIFKDVVNEYGIDEESAERARKAFFALKKNKAVEEPLQRIVDNTNLESKKDVIKVRSRSNEQNLVENMESGKLSPNTFKILESETNK